MGLNPFPGFTFFREWRARVAVPGYPYATWCRSGRFQILLIFFAGMDRMPTFHCKCRLGVKLVSGFSTVHVGGPSPPVSVHWMGSAHQDSEAATVDRLGCQPMAWLWKRIVDPLGLHWAYLFWPFAHRVQTFLGTYVYACWQLKISSVPSADIYEREKANPGDSPQCHFSNPVFPG